ncbi:MAG TPA: TspO/MBR family protein [Pseudolabrys sp.]
MAMTGGPLSLRRDVGSGAFAFILVAAASIAGQVATTPNIADWYDGLVKPSFNPPNWVFAPVWTALFVLMAFTLWRILRHPPSPARTCAIALFLVQLLLSASWSWLFFAAHSPFLGLMNIAPQWLAMVATIAAFRRLDPLAGWCLVPLAAWVIFAALLNASVLALNG